jgi:ACS family tartrate transporter-like MFS transporter
MDHALEKRALYAWSRHSDRTGERIRPVALACAAAGIGLFFAGFAAALVAVVIAVMIAVMIALGVVNSGVGASKPPLWSMPTLFLSGSAAATGIVPITSTGTLGGFVGPSAIGLIKPRTGSFDYGLSFVGAPLLLRAVTTLVIAGTSARESAAAVDAATAKVYHS